MINKYGVLIYQIGKDNLGLIICSMYPKNFIHLVCVLKIYYCLYNLQMSKMSKYFDHEQTCIVFFYYVNITQLFKKLWTTKAWSVVSINQVKPNQPHSIKIENSWNRFLNVNTHVQTRINSNSTNRYLPRVSWLIRTAMIVDICLTSYWKNLANQLLESTRDRVIGIEEHAMKANSPKSVSRHWPSCSTLSAQNCSITLTLIPKQLLILFSEKRNITLCASAGPRGQSYHA